MKLKGKVAIVTGAGRNIGAEVAKLFAAEGAKVAVVDMDAPRGTRTVDAIKASGGDAELFVTDVSKGIEVAAMVKGVVVRFGRVDFDPTRPVTNMLKRAGAPAEAARAILFLASDDSSFIIGENLFVDGGTIAMDQTGI